MNVKATRLFSSTAFFLCLVLVIQRYSHYFMCQLGSYSLFKCVLTVLLSTMLISYTLMVWQCITLLRRHIYHYLQMSLLIHCCKHYWLYHFLSHSLLTRIHTHYSSLILLHYKIFLPQPINQACQNSVNFKLAIPLTSFHTSSQFHISLRLHYYKSCILITYFWTLLVLQLL